MKIVCVCVFFLFSIQRWLTKKSFPNFLRYTFPTAVNVTRSALFWNIAHFYIQFYRHLMRRVITTFGEINRMFSFRSSKWNTFHLIVISETNLTIAQQMFIFNCITKMNKKSCAFIFSLYMKICTSFFLLQRQLWATKVVRFNKQSKKIYIIWQTMTIFIIYLWQGSLRSK